LAAAGISIPVVIHLWNIRQGKTRKIGSIQLLARTAQQSTRSLQLTEWFLLLLRCLLIILIALFLAKPYWKTNTQKGWVMVEQEDAAQAYSHFKPLIDSLLNAGFTLHRFEKGFEETELSAVVNKKNNTEIINKPSYWQLVTLLDKQLSPGMPVYLFTGNRLNRFTGERPAVGILVTWKTFTYADSVQRFIADAYLGSNDSIIVAIGETHPSYTAYHQQTIAANQPRQNEFILNVNNGSLSVSYAGGEPIVVDTATLRITIFANVYTNDIRYLQEAIESIKQVKKKRIDLSVIHTKEQLPAKQDWLFWLSDISIPLNADARSIFLYQFGKIVTIHSIVYTDKPEADFESVVYQRVPYTKTNAEIIWRDGMGIPLLVKTRKNEKQLYRFYSRFDPSWNELPWRASFPELIDELIDPNAKERMDTCDRRVIDGSQVALPVSNNTKTNGVKANTNTTNAKHVVWIILFLIFCAERFFSFRIKKETVYA
jgi:hypothetical protein